MLLSAFILPGLVQLYKWERIKGAICLVLVNIFLLAALFIVMKGMGSFLLTAKVSGPEAALDLLDKVRNDSPLVTILMTGFVFLWFASVVDALLATPSGDDSKSL